jgi:hypothetical protein
MSFKHLIDLHIFKSQINIIFQFWFKKLKKFAYEAMSQKKLAMSLQPFNDLSWRDREIETLTKVSDMSGS